MIIGHITWRGAGLKMVRSFVSCAHAVAGSGKLPPAGSHRSVQCCGAEPEPPVFSIVSDTFAAEVVAPVPVDERALLAGAVAVGAAALPQAAAASPQAAISAPRVRIRVVPCLRSDVMPIGRASS